MKLKIKSTKKHINRGIPASNSSCPIALAFKDVGFNHAYVDADNIELSTARGSHLSIKTPALVKKFIERFDDGKVVKPTVFTFSI
jgi:hypothetical protein